MQCLFRIFPLTTGTRSDHHQFYAGRFPVAFTFIYIQFPHWFLHFLIGWLAGATNISSEIANSEGRTTDTHEKIIAISYMPGFPRAIMTLDGAETPRLFSECFLPALPWSAAVPCSSCQGCFSPSPPYRFPGATTTICVVAGMNNPAK